MRRAVLELPTQVIAGVGCLEELPGLLEERGFQQVGVIADPFVAGTDYIKELLKKLEERGIAYCLYTGVTAEPTFRGILRIYRESGLAEADAIAALGGGSVIDTAKLLCAMAGNPEFAEALADCGENGEIYNAEADLIVRKGLPLFAAPTTAGTGAEATPNAILFSEVQKKKLGIVSRKMIADTVLLDARLTESLPQELAADTCFDALAHAMESFTSKKATAYSDMFAVESMRLIFRNLIPACVNREEEARQKLLLASFYAGVCLVTSSTHIVHAMAYPLAEQFHVAHGKGIAALLAESIKVQTGGRAEEILLRCVPEELKSAAYMTSASREEKGAVKELYRILKELGETAGINRRLGGFGVTQAQCGKMAEAAMANKRLFVNCPEAVTLSQVTEIYKALL